MPDRRGRPTCSYAPTGERLHTLKFVLTGSSGVGKTQLASRIVRGEFLEISEPTAGMEFATRTLRCSEHSSVRAQIWDAAGELPFEKITGTFFRGAVGAMLVYDISRRITFDDLVRWLTLVKQNCHESIAMVLVGNKSDMSSKQREVSMMEGMRFARKHGMDFLETSALEHQHVEEAVRQMVMSVARYLPKEKRPNAWKTADKPSYPLPSGWVQLASPVFSSRGPSQRSAKNAVEQDENVPENFPECILPSRNNSTVMMPPPTLPKRRSKSYGMYKSSYRNGSYENNGYRTGSYKNGSFRNGSYRSGIYKNGSYKNAAVVTFGTSSTKNAPLRFENVWTGEIVSNRPLYPAGPSEACVVSQVPRSLGSSTCLEGCGRSGDEGRKKGEGDGGEKKVFEIVDKSPSWSFAGLKTRGYAAAECLAKCMDP